MRHDIFQPPSPYHPSGGNILHQVRLLDYSGVPQSFGTQGPKIFSIPMIKLFSVNSYMKRRADSEHVLLLNCVCVCTIYILHFWVCICIFIYLYNVVYTVIPIKNWKIGFKRNEFPSWKRLLLEWLLRHPPAALHSLAPWPPSLYAIAKLSSKTPPWRDTLKSTARCRGSSSSSRSRRKGCSALQMHQHGKHPLEIMLKTSGPLSWKKHFGVHYHGLQVKTENPPDQISLKQQINNSFDFCRILKERV